MIIDNNIEQKIIEMIKQLNTDIKENNLKDEDFCIVVLVSGDFFPSRIRFIYKNLIEMGKKFKNDVIKIDSIYDINVKLWIYD